MSKPKLKAVSPVENPPETPPEPAITRPCFACHDDWLTLNGEKKRPGLYWHGWGKGENPAPVDSWICTPIHAIAQTADEHDASHGLLLRFMTPRGRWKEWAAPLEMLKGSGEEYRGELLSQGVRIDPANRNLLSRWLMAQHPKTWITAATRTGWHDTDAGKAFVMPNRTIGAEGIRFQSEHAHHDAFTSRGTLEGWREGVAKPCRGNPVLTLAVSASFAGPLLRAAKLQEQGGAGIHLLGDSSKGKTTGLQAAASVWGAPEFVRTWRATANGLEAAAAGLSDALLVLDEIGECDPREIGAVVYALANGAGKQRASRTGGQRQTARWRVVVLSSGEKGLATHMAEGGKRAKAGQEARLLDIPATGCAYGAFDELHQHKDGRAFADAIKQATARHYGHAGPAFVERLIQDDRDLPAVYGEFLDLPDLQGSDGVESRAAGTLALVALAGELATEYGLTGWKETEALAAAVDAFNAWRAARGSGSTETRQILEAVRDFLDTQGDYRFSDMDATDDHRAIPNRAGYWRETTEGRVYLFNGPALREACPGFDMRRILDALEEAGALPKVEPGKERAKPYRIEGRVMKLYEVNPDHLKGAR